MIGSYNNNNGDYINFSAKAYNASTHFTLLQ